MKTIKMIFSYLIIVLFMFGCTNNQRSDYQMQSDTIKRSLGDTIIPVSKNVNDIIEYLTVNYKYPESAIKNKVEGKIFVQLTIESDGNVSETKILKGLSEDCDKEALRVIKTIQWEPASVNGKPTKFITVIPIKLKLN